MKTEDQVRDIAREVLGLAEVSTKVAQSGVGQITTLNQLGFRGEGAQNRPDGWYLPVDKGAVALVLETKATDAMSIDAPVLRAQVEKYCATVRSQYDLVVGIVYDGDRTRAYVNGKPLDVPDELQPKEFYFSKLTDRPIDKARIYELTQRINNSLHSDFGIKNLYHRMIFTACALVARRYDAILVRGMDYADFHGGILNALNKAIRSDIQQTAKLSLLAEVYSDIKMNVSTDEDDPRAVARLKNLIGDFIDWVTEISGLINSNAWNGEDVMAIFFNEFNRYKKKTESGQVFTPDHITGFMYRLLGVNKDDRILDACAGSGSFLVKAMSNMIREAGGANTTKAKQIKARQLYGIEFDREIYALACANMLIHKDGKTNLAHADARTDSARSWIEQTGATKVLMNPPYENKFGCMKIVENVLNSVDRGTLCGFILPDKKLEKTPKGQMSRILRHHRLLKVVKLPENLFFGIGVTTSIFIFETGKSQDGKKFFAVNIEDDGLITVKNQGRHDVRGKWPALEDYWVEAVERHDDSEHNTGQWVDPAENLSWQAPVNPFVLTHEDLARTAMEYALYRRGIDAKELRERVGRLALYSATVEKDNGNVVMAVPKTRHLVDTRNWGEFRVRDLFVTNRPAPRSIQKYEPGDVPFVASGDLGNGVIGHCEPKKDEVLDSGNCVTVSPVDGSTSYQKDSFLGRGGAGSSIFMLYNDGMTEESGLFVATVIGAVFSQLFGYSNMGNRHKIDDGVIRLPITPAGEPDWADMEKTMRSVMAERAQALNVLMSLQAS